MHPTSFWTCFKSVGAANCDKARILAGFTSIPLFETMNSSSLPAVMPKTHFFRIKPYVVCSEVVKGEAQIVYQCLDKLCLDDHVVHICFHYLADLFFLTRLNHALVSGTSVSKPERHSVETKRPVRGNKCRCGLIGLHLNLMVAGVGIEETQ